MKNGLSEVKVKAWLWIKEVMLDVALLNAGGTTLCRPKRIWEMSAFDCYVCFTCQDYPRALMSLFASVAFRRPWGGSGVWRFVCWFMDIHTVQSAMLHLCARKIKL
jgi:hypothetical protein